MKRKAILIANTNELPGTKKDIEAIRNFLQSQRGGDWYDHEIESLTNPSKKKLLATISTVREKKFDFAFVHFSGHGGQSINNTILEINEENELIKDSDLFDIAPRQATVFDCCRAMLTPSLESKKYAVFSEARSNKREIYEQLIMAAAEQQLKLYACSKGETAGEDYNGGFYTQNLLKSALSTTKYKVTFNEAHAESSRIVKNLSKNKQNPDIISGRHLSSQNLVLSIP